MNLSEDLISELEKHQKVEIALAEAYENSPVTSIAKYLLKGLALDSRKHAHMLKAVTELEETQEFISDQEKATIMKELKKHIEAEKKMLEQYRKFIVKTKDSRAKSVLEHIAADEVRHHKMLKNFHDQLLAKEYELDEVSYEWIAGL